MAKEIERKFLVRSDGWRRAARAGVSYRQGYFPTAEGCTVRVRIAGGKAFLTIKGKAAGLSRDEFEYPIPPGDAGQMLESLCLKPLIEKTRYDVDVCGVHWTVDEFAGANEGLVLAEVELEDERQQIALPDWAGEDVSGDWRYTNRSLVSHPWREWKGTGWPTA